MGGLSQTIWKSELSGCPKIGFFRAGQRLKRSSCVDRWLGHWHSLLTKSWTGHIQKCWEWRRMWPDRGALQMRCFIQDYPGSQPQLERGALGSAVIPGGVKMKLLAIWFCGNRSMAKGASEDRLAYLSICWRQTLGSSEIACRQWCMTALAGEREPWRIGEAGRGVGGGSTEVDVVVTVAFC